MQTKFPYIHTHALLQACIYIFAKKAYQENWENNHYQI